MESLDAVKSYPVSTPRKITELDRIIVSYLVVSSFLSLCFP